MQLSKVGFLGLGLVFAALNASAADLKLSTVRVDLNDRQPNMAMVITNVGTTPSLVHFRVMSWSQDGKTDQLDVTTEVIANPPIAEIAGGARQMVRIGYNGKLQSQTERTYRLFIEEVPKKDRERTEAVETYLKISVPVFVASLAKAEPQVTGFVNAGNSEAPVLVLQNNSNSHVRFLSYALSSPGWAGSKQTGLFYVLAGSAVEVPLDPKERRVTTATLVEMETEAGPLKFPLQKK